MRGSLSPPTLFPVIVEAASAGHAQLVLGTSQLVFALSLFFFVSPISDHNSLQTVPKELTQAERKDIFEYFKNMPRGEKGRTNHFDIDLEGRPTLFVKYGRDVLVEAST